jgi:hypothetical protein
MKFLRTTKGIVSTITGVIGLILTLVYGPERITILYRPTTIVQNCPPEQPKSAEPVKPEAPKSEEDKTHIEEPKSLPKPKGSEKPKRNHSRTSAPEYITIQQGSNETMFPKSQQTHTIWVPVPTQVRTAQSQSSPIIRPTFVTSNVKVIYLQSPAPRVTYVRLAAPTCRWKR